MEAVVDLAMAIAQNSAMEKRLGCVIVHKQRIIAHSANYTVGTLTGYSTGKIVTNVSMHSEMGAIEQLVKKMGLLQPLHRILSGRCCSHRERQRRVSKVRKEEHGPRRC